MATVSYGSVTIAVDGACVSCAGSGYEKVQSALSSARATGLDNREAIRLQ